MHIAVPIASKEELIDLYKRARSLLMPQTWVKGFYRQEIEGRTCYCAGGAVAAANGDTMINLATLEELDREARKCGYGNVEQFNDAAGSVEVVLDLFDATIARLERELQTTAPA